MNKSEINVTNGKSAVWINNILTLVDDKPLDITERIKTFGDAYEWCRENGKKEMLYTYTRIVGEFTCPTYGITEKVDDIIAYLKLRIITCALNEGWEPTLAADEERWFVFGNISETEGQVCSCSYDFEGYRSNVATFLCFKSEKLAEYAAKQFCDIYADFCGCKKGGEQ